MKVAAHRKHNIIVVTHSYLNDDGTISTSPGYGQNSRQYLFDRLISQYPNVKFVFSGHTGVEAARQVTGVNGHRIYAPYTNTSYPQ